MPGAIPSQGFSGYIKILDERTAEQKALDPTPKDFVPVHYFFSNNLYADQVVPPFVALTQGDMDGLATGVGRPSAAGENSGLNHISATSIDCDGKPAAGVTLDITGPAGQLPENAIRWYFSQGNASAVATSTDANGLGGALFLSVGTQHQIAAKNAEGEVVSSTDVLLPPGVFCTVVMQPR